MKIKMTNEAKTGILVLICVVALIALILKVGNFTLLQRGYTLKARLHYTAGVKMHAPVRLSGVDVGEVKAIHILYGDETLVELILWFQDGVKIKTDSKAYVTTLGLMGEKYIEIKAGSAQAAYAKDGELIASQDPVRLEELVEMGTQVAEDISQMAKNISDVAHSVNQTVEGNRKKIDTILDNVEETSEYIRDFSQDIKYHPWKVLLKGKEVSKEEMKKEHTRHLDERIKAKESLPVKQNFTHR